MATFLIVTISWTMSRISSRAFSASKTRQLRQIDRLDEGAEDHAFGYVIVVGTLRLRSGGWLRRLRTLNGWETGQFWRHDKTCHCRLTLIAGVRD